jgi:hypothetical protein
MKGLPLLSVGLITLLIGLNVAPFFSRADAQTGVVAAPKRFLELLPVGQAVSMGPHRDGKVNFHLVDPETEWDGWRVVFVGEDYVKLEMRHDVPQRGEVISSVAIPLGAISEIKRTTDVDA